MESLIAFLIFITFVPLLLVISQIFFRMSLLRRLAILLNLLVWGYEIFFFIAVCGGIPRSQVHFGGGLGDLLFTLILAGLILGHIISLSIMVHKVPKAVFFLIPVTIACALMTDMHLTAARGNDSNNYTAMGNSVGLYYDSEQVYLRNKRQREIEEAAKPQKPEFATDFESCLYDAEHGDTWAQNHIGVCYSEGDGVEKNDTLALKWFRIAAENGNITGQLNLGECYYNGEGGLEVDYTQATKWFRKAAESGLGIAQYQLGLCYFNGNGVEQNKEEAFRWLQMAARKDHKEARKFLKANNQTW